MDKPRQLDGEQDQGQVEGAAHRLVPQRSDHASGGRGNCRMRAWRGLDRSLFSLTASRDREQSFESPEWGGGHGIFTYYVVKGLEGSADENRDGIVTADELAEYVHTEVRRATGAGRIRHRSAGSFDPKMLLAYVPSGAEPGAPPPPKSGALVFEANMDGVEVFIDGKSAGRGE